MTPMSLVASFVPQGSSQRKAHALMLAQHCVAGDGHRTRSAHQYMLVVCGSSADVKMSTEIMGVGLQQVWGSEGASVIYDDTALETAKARFKMLRAMRTLYIYFIINGIANLDPIKIAA